MAAKTEETKTLEEQQAEFEAQKTAAVAELQATKDELDAKAAELAEKEAELANKQGELEAKEAELASQPVSRQARSMVEPTIVTGTIDFSRFATNSSKKSTSLFGACIKPACARVSMGASEEGKIKNGESVKLLELPAGSAITNAYIVVEKAPTATTAQFAVKVGTDTIINSTALGSQNGVAVGSLAGKKVSLLGDTVTVENTVADLSDGVFYVVIEFDEYTKATGEYFNGEYLV